MLRRTAGDVKTMIRRTMLAAIMVGGVAFYTHAAMQSALDREEESRFRDVFPDATSFSPKTGNPPHFRALKIDPTTNRQTLVGFVFYTTDVEPKEFGYEGPIKILVGMRLDGTLTRIKVIEQHEPFGYFSVEPPRFAAQFESKSILDRFWVGYDIDGVSRATITVTSATRAIRNSGLRIARQYLTGG